MNPVDISLFIDFDSYTEKEQCEADFNKFAKNESLEIEAGIEWSRLTPNRLSFSTTQDYPFHSEDIEKSYAWLQKKYKPFSPESHFVIENENALYLGKIEDGKVRFFELETIFKNSVEYISEFLPEVEFISS